MGMPEVNVTACWENNRRVLIISLVTESSPVLGCTTGASYRCVRREGSPRAKCSNPCQ
jgi:hypothetical protein